MSSKGKGSTDETLRQSQLVAGGAIAIKAVDGLKIDIKQVNQQSVTQSIDAMVKADPQLAWLKDAEQRGDVDWRQVREVHDSFKYSHSGLGPASQMIIAIVMSAVIGPMAAAAAGGGVGGAMVGAVATGASTNAGVSVVNNRGNLGAVLKDVTASDAIKGYGISAITAGLTVGHFDRWTDTHTQTDIGKIVTSGSLGTWSGVGQFAANQALQNGTSVLLNKALGQGGSVSDALKNALFNTLAAASFNLVGDYTKNLLADGSAPKVVIHAMVGGLLAEATGGDFKTGALAAAASEALVGHLDDLVKGNDNLLTMSSQIVGVLAAAAQSDTDVAKLETGSWVAKNATQYNYLSHNQLERAAKQITRCTDASCIEDATRKFIELSLQQDIDAIVSCQADPDSCAARSMEVANTQANLNAIRDIADDASPEARAAVQNLINGNYEFQEMLATATTEHSVGAMVDSLKAKWELSDAQAQDIADNLKIALAVGVGTAAGVVAYRRAVAGGAKAIPESSYPSLAKPSPNAPSNVILGELDSLGRPTGVTAVLREDSLGGGSSANPAIRPPGFEGQPANHARGHLLANSLGGAGDDARNLVTLFQRNANHPNMSSFERQVRGAVQSGETVSYRAVPIYTGTNPMPTGVTLSARGSGGFTLDVSIPNVSGVK